MQSVGISTVRVKCKNVPQNVTQQCSIKHPQKKRPIVNVHSMAAMSIRGTHQNVEFSRKQTLQHYWVRHVDDD